MFEDWLVAPSNVVAWAIQLFTRFGPLPFLVTLFIILVVVRPHVPKSLPMHHRRAINEMQWTFHIALSFALVAVMATPAMLVALHNAGLISDVGFNSMNTMIVLVVGVAYLLPWLVMVHIWFPRPVNWYPNKNWKVSPRIRVWVWVVVMLIWIFTEIVMVGAPSFSNPRVLRFLPRKS